MKETLDTYGRVGVLPGAVQVTSVPYEAVIRKIEVHEGQAVVSGQSLGEVVPSATAQLEWEQARLRHEAAKKNMTLIRRRMDLKVATREELLAAQEQLDLSLRRLNSLLTRGLDGPATLKAASNGIVWQIHVQPGQIVPPGQRMFAVVPRGKEGVILGVEPEDIVHVHPGQAVRITRVNAVNSPAINGKISLVTRQINPETRLIDVLVQPDVQRHNLLLNDYVSGQIVISVHRALVAPGKAVLPDDEDYHLFTIVNHRAVRHKVRIGLEKDHFVQVLSRDLHEGMKVVTEGNDELADGMPVREEAKP